MRDQYGLLVFIDYTENNRFQQSGVMTAMQMRNQLYNTVKKTVIGHGEWVAAPPYFHAAVKAMWPDPERGIDEAIDQDVLDAFAADEELDGGKIDAIFDFIVASSMPTVK